MLQLVADMSWLFFAGILVIRFNEQLAVPLQSVVAPALVFATVIVLLNIAFGMYRRADKLTSSTYLVRMLLVPAIGVPLAYLIVSALPTGRLLQNNLGMAVLVAIGGLLLIRHLLVLPLMANLAPHRVLVLGTGPEARLVEASLSAANLPGMNLVGFFALEKVQRDDGVAAARDRPRRPARAGSAPAEDQRDHRRRARAARRRAAAALAARMPAERRAA